MSVWTEETPTEETYVYDIESDYKQEGDIQQPILTSDRSGYTSLNVTILNEISEVLSHIDKHEVETLVDEIIKAEKVFFIGVGRVFLSLQCMAKRLHHLGIDANVVGSITENAITGNDLLLVASGSGESIVPVEISKKAKKIGARIGLITSARSSTIKSMSDFAVHLPCPTKNDLGYGVNSIQPMSTLFDQVLHLFGDIVALIIQDLRGMSKEELWNYHANLE